MTIEADIFTTLKLLVGSRVYRDTAPQTITQLPYITFQQVGGVAVNFLEPSVPSQKNGRFQFNIWASSRDEVAALARQTEDALRQASGLNTNVLSAPVALYEEELDLYGSRQDFSFWFDN